MMQNKPEILAPAGTYESLIAAVRSGADAVYLGTSAFNARMKAENFAGEKLKEAVDYCHARNVKVHITVNTLLLDREIKEALDTIKLIAVRFILRTTVCVDIRIQFFPFVFKLYSFYIFKLLVYFILRNKFSLFHYSVNPFKLLLLLYNFFDVLSIELRIL